MSTDLRVQYIKEKTCAQESALPGASGGPKKVIALGERTGVS
jgi:hypothetical protein